MSSISSVGGYSSYSPYQTIARGGTYNKAAEGASELATKEKTEKVDSQVKGQEKNSENPKTEKSALKVENGAMAGIADYLKSVKEQSVKAMNGTKTDADIKTVNEKVKQYMEGVQELSKSESESGEKSDGAEHAPTYNSRAAMELGGYQTDKEETNTEGEAQVQQLKARQGADVYQRAMQAQKQKDQEQQSMLLFA